MFELFRTFCDLLLLDKHFRIKKSSSSALHTQFSFTHLVQLCTPSSALHTQFSYLLINFYFIDLFIQAWRFLTYQFVHVNLEHIVFNTLMQLVVGLPLEMSQPGVWGTLRLYNYFHSFKGPLYSCFVLIRIRFLVQMV